MKPTDDQRTPPDDWDLRYTPEEIGDRGDKIFEREIRPTLKPEQEGYYVVIDADGRGWEVDSDLDAAVDRLDAKLADPQTYIRRTNSRTTGRRRWR